MRELTNPRPIWTKDVLFLLVGAAAAAHLILEAPTMRVAVLLAIAV